MPFRLSRVTLAFALLAGTLTGGCASQRPLVVVRQDADRAYEQKNYDQALNDYAEYVDRRPHDAQAQYDLGKTLLVLNKPVEAREHMSVARDLDPRNDTYLDGYADALVQAGEYQELSGLLRTQAETSGRIEDYIRWGKYAAKAGDVDEAERALKTAAKLDRGRTKAPQLALADFYTSVGDKASAFKRLRMALYLAPKDQAIYDKIRALGEIPGPSISMPPEEVE
jgi:tetratricopeptide (TPR) repeat protein